MEYIGIGKDALFVFDQVAGVLGYKKNGQSSGADVVNKEITEALKALQRSTLFLRIGGLSGALAVSMAAYGAHVPELQNNLQRRQIYEIGYKMQLVHSVALAHSDNCSKPYVTGGLFTLGILLYSGSCYAQAIWGNAWYRKFTLNAGEVVLAIAWLSILIP
ncbi:transmembrane protein 256 homolog isoform X1 [Saccostrea echinata]|uniref:transmembrane protein 256 homolog isoform X1 n=1 Tax=Saccostrea echinata TaxID=191078 RepID=UPI002A816620|nr:transmembrane protein 256 homolog isoform X1 [Saccostrea echinata]